MNAPDIGELDKLVRVRKWVDRANNAFALDQVVDAGQDAWARIDPAGTALFYGTAQIEKGMTHRMATWRTAALNEVTVTGEHVVEHDGMRYRVRRATDWKGRRQFLILDLEQLGTIPP